VTPERLASLIAARGIAIGHIGGGGRPEWTSQDAAIALAAIDPPEIRRACFAAFTYRWAGADDQRSTLYGCLMNEAAKIAENEGWPSRIREQRYVERLVRMAILEERFWWIINKSQLWPHLMTQDGFKDMDQHLWERRLSRRYEAIRHVIETWCSIAHYHMLSRIKGDVGS
jgi:hypothetical protein